jgi:hypothetical protein
MISEKTNNMQHNKDISQPPIEMIMLPEEDIGSIQFNYIQDQLKGAKRIEKSKRMTIRLMDRVRVTERLQCKSK